MKFTAAAILAAAVSGVQAGNYGYGYSANVTVTTDVVTAYTTYCPYATKITQGSSTYTVTEPTTLTITNCPCTITYPVTVTPATSAPYVPSSAPYVNTNTTLCTSNTPAPPVGTGGVKPSTSAPSVPTGGAGKAAALSGGALAGIVAIAAFVL